MPVVKDSVFYPKYWAHVGLVKYNFLQLSNQPSILPTGSLATVYMTPDDPGEWALVCRTTKHLTLGMESKYTVRGNCGKTPSAEQTTDKVRRYYIAAMEETWDYTPSGRDILGGKSLEGSE